VGSATTDAALSGRRGLALVDGLSSAWGWEPIPTGKLVWFELPAAAAKPADLTSAVILH
jgi:hypothetical protein